MATHFPPLWGGRLCAVCVTSSWSDSAVSHGVGAVLRRTERKDHHFEHLAHSAEARAEATEVLRLNPNFSLEVHKQREPIKDPAVLERHIAALRKAGLK